MSDVTWAILRERSQELINRAENAEAECIRLRAEIEVYRSRAESAEAERDRRIEIDNEAYQALEVKVASRPVSSPHGAVTSTDAPAVSKSGGSPPRFKQKFAVLLLILCPLFAQSPYTCTIVQSTLPNNSDIPVVTVIVTGPPANSLLSVVLEYRDRQKRVHHLASAAFQIGAGQWETEFIGIRQPVAAYVQPGI